MDSLFLLKGDLYVHAPGGDNGSTGDWRLRCRNECGGMVTALVTAAGSVVLGHDYRISRGTDRALAWTSNVAEDRDAIALVQADVAGLRDSLGHGYVYGLGLYRAFRSSHDGAPGTWESGGPTGGYAAALAAVPPSAALPQGRLLAGVYNGITYSDDGAASWQPSSLYGQARWVGASFAFLPDAAHPYGGVVYAGSEDVERWRRDGVAVVHRSDDGGATWTLVHRFDEEALGLPIGSLGLGGPVLFAAPDGTLWASVWQVKGGQPPYPGRIVRSTDGGVTWTRADDGFGAIPETDYGFRVHGFALHRDGRLFAATDYGAWHTTDPVWAVASDAPPAASGLAVAVRPNPAGGAVVVSLQAPAGASVTVEVLDRLGRRVATVHQGRVAGAREWRVEAAGWAPGVYVVRASDGATTATSTLTVAR